VTRWPPEIKDDQQRVPRHLRSWNFTRDGPLWGAVLTLLVWVSVFGFILALVVGDTP